MLKRPSSRRRGAPGQVNLNLVPILDTLVTLIVFLLFTTSFLSIVGIESPFPQASAKDVQERLKEKPLQLTLTLRENESEIWSPFDKFAAKKIQNPIAGQPDIKLIHDALIDVKKGFPNETKIVLVPAAGINYDILVSVMDSVRAIEATDPPVFFKNAQTGADEVAKKLFPEVIFGNLLGTGEI